LHICHLSSARRNVSNGSAHPGTFKVILRLPLLRSKPTLTATRAWLPLLQDSDSTRVAPTTINTEQAAAAARQPRMCAPRPPPALSMLGLALVFLQWGMCRSAVWGANLRPQCGHSTLQTSRATSMAHVSEVGKQSASRFHPFPHPNPNGWVAIHAMAAAAVCIESL
jgi:hypothetical protein